MSFAPHHIMGTYPQPDSWLPLLLALTSRLRLRLSAFSPVPLRLLSILCSPGGRHSVRPHVRSGELSSLARGAP